MTIGLAFAVIFACMAVGALLYVLISRRSPEGGREKHTPTNVYAVTAGAMSLLIAFTMSMTFNLYNTAQSAVQTEANAVASMSRAATFMDPVVRDPLRDELVCYQQAVIEDEWPSMEEGSSAESPRVRASLANMDAILSRHVQEAGTGLDIWEGANETRMQSRHVRLLSADSTVPPLLWALLLLGSLITVGSLFVYADSSKPAWGHALVVIGPLFVASASMVVIAFFDHPFVDTPGGISATPLQSTLTAMTTEPVADIPLPSCKISTSE